MQYPKMILFDYGHTLAYEPGFDPLRGTAELLKHAARNPNHCTLAQVRERSDLVYGKYLVESHGMGYEIPAQAADRVLYGSLGIEFGLTPLEMETIFWEAASMGAIMPGADEMLRFIRQHGIRSAVISNIIWSGAALTERLRRLLPGNQFEFVLVSSDYFFKKAAPAAV